MSGSSDRSAWGDFWQDRRGDSGFPKERLRRIEAVQQRCWEDFAQTLPAGARVLDLGTGSGIVLATMRRVRPDLDLVGVDSAPQLPAAPTGVLLKSGVKMEALPLADGSFTAATSQFAYEYGETSAIATEVGRVLTGGGQLQLLIHHAMSPIVAYHRDRYAALHWAVAGSSCLQQARALVSAQRQLPANLTDAVDEARRHYPDQPVAAEFVGAVLQSIELGQQHPREKVLEVLDVLDRRAASELARLDSLTNAACDTARIERIRAEIEKVGCETKPLQTLSDADGAPPFGWLVKARRSGAIPLPPPHSALPFFARERR